MGIVSANDTMSHKLDILTTAIWTTLAGAGGAVRYLSSQIRSGEKICVKTFIFLLIINSFISGFSGLMLALFATTVTQNHTMHLIAAGMGGYLGVEILNLLSCIVKLKLKSFQPK